MAGNSFPAERYNSIKCRNSPNLNEHSTSGKLRVESLPLSSLKPAKRNPKRHKVETVITLMERFGYVAPMILNERTGQLVAGHGRLESLIKAMKEGKQPPSRILIENGEWLVPVVRGVAFADDREAEAYLLADNQTTILGGWNDEELKQIIESLGAEDVEGTGFENLFEIEQDDPTPLIDNAAELQKKWETRTRAAMADRETPAALRG